MFIRKRPPTRIAVYPEYVGDSIDAQKVHLTPGQIHNPASRCAQYKSTIDAASSSGDE